MSGVAFSLGFVFPFGKTVKLFGDGLLEVGNNESYRMGLIADWATPGFDAGISFLFWRDNGNGLGFDIKYQGAWYYYITNHENHYVHAIGIVFVMSLGRGWSPW
jgi:hypothetical protein